jgi:predicted HNH restriction endonuclease
VSEENNKRQEGDHDIKVWSIRKEDETAVASMKRQKQKEALASSADDGPAMSSL